MSRAFDNQPLQYNDFVRQSFARPQFIASKDLADTAVRTATGGDRETGVEFRLFMSQTNALHYAVYGSPYAIAAAELLCQKYSDGELKLGDQLDTEQFKADLDMPYNYFFILLALEDAWLGL